MLRGGSDLKPCVGEDASPRPFRESSASRAPEARDEFLFMMPCKNPDIIYMNATIARKLYK